MLNGHSQKSKVDVLIVGAGPAGLMLANWFSRTGVSARIVDKRGTKVIEILRFNNSLQN
jgi:2-polyprenyl-6-methoxyphenol hydroxylase-like FAD-dependent oxidoreductase